MIAGWVASVSGRCSHVGVPAAVELRMVAVYQMVWAFIRQRSLFFAQTVPDSAFVGVPPYSYLALPHS